MCHLLLSIPGHLKITQEIFPKTHLTKQTLRRRRRRRWRRFRVTPHTYPRVNTSQSREHYHHQTLLITPRASEHRESSKQAYTWPGNSSRMQKPLRSMPLSPITEDVRRSRFENNIFAPRHTPPYFRRFRRYSSSLLYTSSSLSALFILPLSYLSSSVLFSRARACLSVCARALYFLPAAFAHKVCAFVMPCGESLALFIFKCARVRHAYSCPAKITLAVGIRKIAKRKIKEQREVGERERERAFFEWEKISFMIICFVARSDVAVLIYLPGL